MQFVIPLRYHYQQDFNRKSEGALQLPSHNQLQTIRAYAY